MLEALVDWSCKIRYIFQNTVDPLHTDTGYNDKISYDTYCTDGKSVCGWQTQFSG